MRIQHPNRDRKIKDKKSSGCGLCKPWKHGWTNEQGKGKPDSMRQVRLTRQEREIEGALIRGEYVDVPKSEFEKIARAVARR